MSDNHSNQIEVEIRDLTMAFGSYVVMRDVQAAIRRSEVFIIMGGSGCGKSTLLNHMIGLLRPAKGDILYGGRSIWQADDDERATLLRTFGVLFQGSALWSSMTLSENIALPLSEYTELTPDEIRDVARLKLSLVGLAGFEDHYPSQISGGMQKRAGLARAMALDPEILFFDEPSSGLDPVSARNLDRLILELRDSLGTTVIVVSHDLESIFTIGDNSIYLDPASKSMRARGNPRELRDHSEDESVRNFLTSGLEKPAGERPVQSVRP